VFDIWYRNTSDIVPSAITGDMHSINKANFAILHWFGLRFEPRDTCLDDISEIARGQLLWEDQARAQQPPLLILDTHLLSNILWSTTLFADCPTWIEPALLARHYDLHLLLSPLDVNWTSDGQRCQPELSERVAFFNATRDWLEAHRQPLQIIRGDWEHRRQRAFEQVEKLLQN
jgi:nicotinamide riboside kinase